VEDDVELSGAVTRRLRQQAYEVVVTPSCSTTLALTCCFDVGVFEIELVDGDGVQLAEGLQDAELVERVVFYTSTQARSALARASKVGPVVAKRDGAEALLPVVQGLLGCRSQTQSMVVPSNPEPASTTSAKKRLQNAG
jgi:DNA-binding response OmpR family regulator